MRQVHSRTNLPPNYVNVFHLIWIMSLTLPFEIQNVYRARTTIELLEKETLWFIPPKLWPPNAPDLNPVDYRVWGILQEKCSKYSSLIWTNWNSDWERSGSSWIMSSLRQPFVSGVVDSFKSVMRVLYTFSRSISTRCNQLNSNLANMEATIEVG